LFLWTDEGGQKLYVGNLPFDVTTDDLIGLFEKYGNVKDCFLPTDRETGEPRGFAFVTLDDEEAAEKAIEATNDMEFLGRPLVVNKPIPPGEKKASRNNRIREYTFCLFGAM
jgi:cold-inducible RNA-binding protein